MRSPSPPGGPPGRSGARRRAAALAAAFLLPAVAGACSLFLKKPSIRIAEVRIGSVGLVGATARVALDVANPNDFELRAEEIRYRLSFEDRGADGGWRTLAEGTSVEEHAVPPGDSAQVVLSLPFRYTDVGLAVVSLLQEGELGYRFEGDVKFDVPGPNLRVPFDKRGRLTP